MSEAFDDIESLLHQARGGDQVALGQLLEMYRSYVGLLARLQIKQNLRGKVSESDLVQETFLRAKRGFSQFRGQTEGELVTWLCTILAAQFANLVRHYSTKQRDINLEVQLAQLDHSSQQLGRQLAAKTESPSQSVVRRE